MHPAPNKVVVENRSLLFSKIKEVKAKTLKTNEWNSIDLKTKKWITKTRQPQGVQNGGGKQNKNPFEAFQHGLFLLLKKISLTHAIGLIKF